MSVVITLAWPARSLSPNARVHWAVKSKAVKRARATAYMQAISDNVASLRGSQKLSVTASFTPPDARHRDTDNMLASIKSYCDGIADACGVNDAAWVWNAPVINAPVMPGNVSVTLARLPE